MSVRLRIAIDKFGSSSKNLDSLLDIVVRRVAFLIQAGAQQRVPVATGAAKASIHTITSRDDNQDAAYTEARRVSPGVDLFSEKEPQKILKATVGVGVGYGWWLERGTSFLSPRAFLQPAAEEQIDTFRQGITEAIRLSLR